MAKIVINPENDSITNQGDENTIDIHDGTSGTTNTTNITDGEDSKPDVVTIGNNEYVLDDSGNALNEDGSVFKTKEELETSDTDDEEGATEDSVVYEIEGKKFTIDKDGNAIDDKGEITYTKDQLAEMEEDQVEDGQVDVSKIISETAIIIHDADGNPVEYENSEEGLKSYVTDVYTRASNDAISELFNTYPTIEGLVYHLSAGGSFEDFNNFTDYSKVKLDKKNEDQLKNIIYTAQSKRGNTPQQIDRYYKALKAGDTDNDELFVEAQEELKYLADTNKNEIKRQQELIAQQEQARQQELAEYWGVEVRDGRLVDLGVENSVYNIIKTGNIKLKDSAFKIPDKIRVVEDGKPKLYTRDDFFRYLKEPIVVNQNGNRITTTRHQLDLDREMQSRNTNNDIYDAYRRFVKYDDSQFIKEQVNNDRVTTIKKLKPKRVAVNTGTQKGGDNTKKKIIIKRN